MLELAGSSTIGDRGNCSFITPDIDAMHIRIFESSKLKGSYVGDLPEPIDGKLGLLPVFSYYTWCCNDILSIRESFSESLPRRGIAR